ncbi:MAG: MASE3 domain-containing protein [Bacillota bacterium]|nr:MASE3 domain-containing protein [Bacillota bacterium]
MKSKELSKRIYGYKKLGWLGLVIVVSIVMFQNLNLLGPFFKRVTSVSEYLTWHIVFEFISVFVSICVFILSYYAYRQNRRLRVILIANVFLSMGLIDIFHTLSYKGMPYFLTDNITSNRATTLWIISRLFGALGITMVSLIKKNRKSNIDRRFFSLISVLLSLSVLILATYFPHVIPAMYVEKTGVTQIKKILEYVVILLLLFAGIMYLKQYLRNKDKSNLVFTIAITTSIFSELAFVSYTSVYDIYNYIGHVYKFISYFLVFRVVLIINIQRPYLALFKAKDKLKKYAGNLYTLVSERTTELQKVNQELYLINQKLLEDLDFARDIQKAILPDRLPNSDEVAFEAKYYPAEKVSGDFYNIFRLDENRIGMYIGDVSGHGVPAAMLTMFLSQSIKTVKELDGSKFEVLKPSKVLETLYELYNKMHFKDEMYILIFYAIYNVKTRELEYSSAGLNAQPILIKSNSELAEIDIKGLPICSLINISKTNYTDKIIKLEKGDRMFFYTDGLTELNYKKTGNVITLEQLGKFLTKNDSKGCLFSELDREIKFASSNEGLTDDITFFMLQVN